MLQSYLFDIYIIHTIYFFQIYILRETVKNM